MDVIIYHIFKIIQIKSPSVQNIFPCCINVSSNFTGHLTLDSIWIENNRQLKKVS